MLGAFPVREPNGVLWVIRITVARRHDVRNQRSVRRNLRRRDVGKLQIIPRSENALLRADHTGKDSGQTQRGEGEKGFGAHSLKIPVLRFSSFLRK